MAIEPVVCMTPFPMAINVGTETIAGELRAGTNGVDTVDVPADAVIVVPVIVTTHSDTTPTFWQTPAATNPVPANPVSVGVQVVETGWIPGLTICACALKANAQTDAMSARRMSILDSRELVTRRGR